jgi:tetratricopeptide (TPR) repeat protein
MLKLWHLPALVLIVAVSLLVLRPEPQLSELRATERLWHDRRTTEALRRYQSLQSSPIAPALVDVRLAALFLLRGDCSQAQISVAAALRKPVRRDEAAQAHLIAGQCAALRGDLVRAQAEWASVDPRSPYHPLAAVLHGEYALRAGQRSTAIERYTTALTATLDEPWRGFVHFRLALALALSAPDDALQHLAAIPASLPDPDPATRPLLPLAAAQIAQQSRQLHAILELPPTQHAQLLGQHLLDLNLIQLALAAFEQVPLDAPNRPIAEAHAAYARWQLGQTNAAAAQLRELVTRYPQEPLIATLYATVAIDAAELDAAAAALDAAEARNVLDPAIALVRSDLLAARREYPQAIMERRRARDIARPEVRGRYALALAQQHLDLTYKVCDDGITAAREATTIAANDPRAWHLLSAMLYHCRSYIESAEAAQQGLQRAPNDPALHFFLGAAQWEVRARESGRLHLLAAADFAPAGEWRSRAEQVLGLQ